jgi:hypothetical protein
MIVRGRQGGQAARRHFVNPFTSSEKSAIYLRKRDA